MAIIRNNTCYVIHPRVLVRRLIVYKGRKIVGLVCLGNRQRNTIKRLTKKVKGKWSPNVVNYLRRTVGPSIHTEDVYFNVDKPEERPIIGNDVSQQLREQLELLNSGKLIVPLIEPTDGTVTSATSTNTSCVVEEHSSKPVKSVLEPMPDLTPRTNQQVPHEVKVEQSVNNKATGGSGNFLDRLMRKVGANTTNVEHGKSPVSSPVCSSDKDSTSSGDDFLGFDDQSPKNQGQTTALLSIPCVAEQDAASDNKSVFVSESLDKYLRANALDTQNSKDSSKSQAEAAEELLKIKSLAGLVTQNSTPPPMDMPLVPESLARLRTVAERRHFLQRCTRNHKLAIINNEAGIYRELQRKVRRHHQPVRKHAVMQAAGALLPSTRTGWRATSFIATECNKYYYQMLCLDQGQECVRLAGGRGNNDKFLFSTYIRGRLIATAKCDANCVDARTWLQFKRKSSQPTHRAILNKTPLPPALPPCPLSKKPFQKPLDEDTGPLLVAGGKMMVMRMPTVQLEVFPEAGKPLDELAKRYLQYIMPHDGITEEWAKFSVSTLKVPINHERDKIKKGTHPCSYKFDIPYANDRSQILVRRIIDRSEKIDQAFEDVISGVKPYESLKTDLSFRANIDQNDGELLAVADVISEMINCVAISCSENSFIKDDPDAISYATKKETTLDSKELLELPADQKQPHQPYDAKHHRKQSRLVNELRRLNATIIETTAPTSETPIMKTCKKESCVLGCVCSSLNGKPLYHQHCGKSRCVLECRCRQIPQDGIMRLETDARNITTQDAFNLREQATARLARMEKEFTSTVVLSENEPLLINESQYEKKRRCTKAPKRYEDYAETSATDTDTTSEFNSPVKGRLTPASNTSGALESNRRSVTPALSETPAEIVYVEDSVLEELKHCSISLTRIEIPKHMAVWCMVHELYNCFCGARATEGKPIVIEVEPKKPIEIQAPKGSNVNLAPVAFVAKSRYSFDKHEKKLNTCEKVNKVIKVTTPAASQASPPTTSAIKKPNIVPSKPSDERKSPITSSWGKRNDIASKPKSYKHHEPESSNDDEEVVVKIEPGTEMLHNDSKWVRSAIIESYLSPRADSCSRAVQIPAFAYRQKNVLRRHIVHDYIRRTENKKTRLTLSEHWMRSVFYYKRELEANRRRMNERENKRQDSSSKSAISKIQQIDEIVELSDDGVDNMDANENNGSGPMRQYVNKKRKLNTPNNVDLDSSSSSIAEKKHELSSDVETQDKTARKTDNGGFLKITNCFSMNENADNSSKDLMNAFNCKFTNGPTNNINDEVTATTSSQVSNPSATTSRGNQDTPRAAIFNNPTWLSLIDVLGSQPANSKHAEFYFDIIKNMNCMVGKKIQDIDTAMHRESIVVPPPNDDILCIVTWKNFHDAFKYNNIYVWQIKLPDKCFLGVTIMNIMPIVIGAIAVENIVYVKPEQLPLMGRLLVNQISNESTADLGIVMQGHKNYWHIKGFLKPDPKSACAKPTPGTHPLLTSKINLLFTLLVKQSIKRIREAHQRKLTLSAQSNANSSPGPGPLTAIVTPLGQVLASQKSTVLDPKIRNTQNDNDLKLVQQNQEPALLQPTPLALVKRTSISSSSSPSPTVLQMKSQQTNVGGDESQPLMAQPTSGINSVLLLKALGRPLKTHKMNNEQYESEEQNFVDSPTSRIKMDTKNTKLFDNIRIGMASNVIIRRIRQDDVDELIRPNKNNDDDRWYVLDMHNDFSHIFLPDFKDLVSLDRIHRLMSFSKQRNKIVRLHFNNFVPDYDVFVTPISMRKLYIGPLKPGMNPPNIILLQSVDGQLMLRETFQVNHNIKPNSMQSTTAFWMVQVDGQILFEIDLPSSAISHPLIIGNINKHNQLILKDKINSKSLKPIPLQQLLQNKHNNTTIVTTTSTTSATVTATDTSTSTAINLSHKAINQSPISTAPTTLKVPSIKSSVMNSDDEDDCLIIDEDNSNDGSLQQPQQNTSAASSTTTSTANNKNLFTFSIQTQNNKNCVQIGQTSIMPALPMDQKTSTTNQIVMNSMPMVLPINPNTIMSLSPRSLTGNANKQQQQQQRSVQQHPPVVTKSNLVPVSIPTKPITTLTSIPATNVASSSTSNCTTTIQANHQRSTLNELSAKTAKKRKLPSKLSALLFDSDGSNCDDSISENNTSNLIETDDNEEQFEEEFLDDSMDDLVDCDNDDNVDGDGKQVDDVDENTVMDDEVTNDTKSLDNEHKCSENDDESQTMNKNIDIASSMVETVTDYENEINKTTIESHIMSPSTNSITSAFKHKTIVIRSILPQNVNPNQNVSPSANYLVRSSSNNNKLSPKTVQLQSTTMKNVLNAGFTPISFKGATLTKLGALALNNMKVPTATTIAPLIGNITNSPIDKNGQYLRINSQPVTEQTTTVNVTETGAVMETSDKTINTKSSINKNGKYLKINPNNIVTANNNNITKHNNNNKVKIKTVAVGAAMEKNGKKINNGNSVKTSLRPIMYRRPSTSSNGHVSHGLFVSKIPHFPKFPTKRVRDSYYITVQNLGTITFHGERQAINFLNEYVKKKTDVPAELKDILPVRFSFYPFEANNFKRPPIPDSSIEPPTKRTKTTKPLNTAPILTSNVETIVIDDD